jgi:hypothetical protein
LQLSAVFGRFQAAKSLQLPLIPWDLVRPVTPKVAGSSPVAPAICGCRVMASSAAEVFAFDGSDGRQFLFEVLTALAFRVHCTYSFCNFELEKWYGQNQGDS